MNDITDNWWNGVDGYYIAPSFNYKKGSVMKVYFKFNKEILIDPKDLFLYEWTLELPNKSIKAFKILQYYYDNYSLTIELEVIKKSKDLDEVKHLYKDIHDFFNYYDVQIEEFITILIN
ncbi:hypothetical protein IM538_13710 [Cytobacillus suaedae]|nr:hypothetical protein IM538_13710 [Cytobacillus suaedae]